VDFPGEPQRGRRARAAFESEDGRVAVLRSDAPGALSAHISG